METLTARIVEEAEALIRRIDGMGGALAAIEAKRQIVVGVNEFVMKEERPIPTLSVDPVVEDEQRARLQALRARRDPSAVERGRQALVNAAREGRNLVPPLIDAVTHLVTLGEAVESLKTVFGDYREIPG